MFSNLGIKLVCLLVAALLWAQVASTVEVEQMVRLPMEVVGLADTLAVARHQLPESVSVRIRGSRLQLLAADVVQRELGRVQLDLSPLGPGRHRYDVSVLDVRVNATAMEVVPPVSLDLTVQRRVSKSVPVKVRLAGQLPEGYSMAGRPEASPNLVEVTGPQSLVDDVVEIATTELRLGRRRSSFQERVSLQPADPDLQMRPIEVQVAVGIEEVVERTFEEVPITVLSNLDPEWVSLEVTSVLVRVVGPVGRVQSLLPEEVSVIVPIGDDVRGVTQVPAEVVLPDGLSAASVQPSSIQVIVDVADSTASGGQ